MEIGPSDDFHRRYRHIARDDRTNVFKKILSLWDGFFFLFIALELSISVRISKTFFVETSKFEIAANKKKYKRREPVSLN